MKIFYVEDELSRNIPKIKRLFERYLSKEILVALDEEEEDSSGYGTDGKEIKDIVNRSPIVHIEHNYPSALREITTNYQQYDLFIIDRNLAEEEYSLEELQAIVPSFSEQLYNKYFTREGDYFLEYLMNKTDVMQHFYFLTANSNDSLRNAEDIQSHIDFGRFCAANFIDKSDSAKINKLRSRIDNSEVIKLRYTNSRYLAVLESIEPALSDRFFDLLQHSSQVNPEEIRKNLTTIRNIYEHLLTHFARCNNAPSECFNVKNRDQIVQRAVVSWILGFDHQWKKYTYSHSTSSIIKNFLYDIQEIASDFGDHNRVNKDGYQPTSDTVQTLVFGLKDIIIWFKKETNH